MDSKSIKTKMIVTIISLVVVLVHDKVEAKCIKQKDGFECSASSRDDSDSYKATLTNIHTEDVKVEIGKSVGSCSSTNFGRSSSSSLGGSESNNRESSPSNSNSKSSGSSNRSESSSSSFRNGGSSSGSRDSSSSSSRERGFSSRNGSAISRGGGSSLGDRDSSSFNSRDSNSKSLSSSSRVGGESSIGGGGEFLDSRYKRSGDDEEGHYVTIFKLTQMRGNNDQTMIVPKKGKLVINMDKVSSSNSCSKLSIKNCKTNSGSRLDCLRVISVK